jgi:AbrB family looped-hinge helix DNA binding protein
MRSRISSKGQVTVPVGVRAALGLLPGTPVEFVVREGEAVMRKGEKGAEPIDRVYGKLRLDRPVDALLDEMRGPAPRPRPSRTRRQKTR